MQLWETGLEKAKAQQDTQAMGFFLGSIGVAYHRLSDYPKALKYHQLALKNARDSGNKKNEVTALINCGNIYKRLFDYPQVLKYHRQAVKIYRDLGDKKGEATSLRIIGNANKSIGDYTQALKYNLQALQIRRSRGDKKGEASSLGSVGNTYDHLGDYPKALEYHQQALELHRALNDRDGVGIDLNNIGVVYQSMGEFGKALKNFIEVLEITRELKDTKGEGMALGNIGLAFKGMGDYRRALDNYLLALSIAQVMGDKPSEGLVLSNMGSIFAITADYPQALELYRKALAVYRDLDDKNGEGDVLGNIGIVYHNLGNPTKALEHLQRSMKINRELGDKNSVGAAHINIANVYSKIGDYPEALKQAQQALQIAREIGAKDSEAAALGNMGTVYAHLGDLSKALEIYQEVYALLAKIDAPTVTVRLNIGDIYLERGDLDNARLIYNTVKGENPIRWGRWHLAKKDFAKAKEVFKGGLARAEDDRRSSVLLANYTGLGLACEGLNDNASAFDYFRQAAELIEKMRSMLTESQRAGFFGASDLGFDRLEAYEGLVRTAKSSSGGTKGAFYYAEFTKGRLLAESISSKFGASKPSISPTIGERETMLVNKIASTYKQMDAAFEKNATDRYKELESELAALRKSRGEFVAQLRADYPEYAAINYPEPVAAADLALAPDETLLEFEVTRTETLLFVLSGKDRSLKTRRIKISRKQLAETVDKYRRVFVTAASADDLAKYDPAAGKKIFDLLFADSLRALPEGAKLIIVPDEVLSILPFESLPTALPAVEKIGEGKHGPFPMGVRYLGDKYTVSYAQSATSLSLLRTLKKGWAKSSAALAVVDPVFSATDKRAAALLTGAPDKDAAQRLGAITRWKKMGVGGRRRKGAGRAAAPPADSGIAIFPRLEKTAEIGLKLKKLFGKEATVIAGAGAREEAIRKMPLEGYRYIVFGTHGILDGALPYIRQPALLLNQVGNDKGYDGFLTMTEVMGLKMSAEVVALTACDTGVGKNVSGEGVMGMGRAFQYAGAANVLISLWSVSEDATVALSGNFFGHLKGGKSPPEALRLAREAIRREGYEHPFYWSAFVLMGR